MSARWTFVGVKFGSLTPILVRDARFSPRALCALLVTAAATVIAVVTSRADDWDKPLIIILVGALALLADRNAYRTPTGSTVVATHPVFVLGM